MEHPEKVPGEALTGLLVPRTSGGSGR